MNIQIRHIHFKYKNLAWCSYVHVIFFAFLYISPPVSVWQKIHILLATSAQPLGISHACHRKIGLLRAKMDNKLISDVGRVGRLVGPDIACRPRRSR